MQPFIKMKKFLFIIPFILLFHHLFGQTLINISTSPKTVPAGKKWVLGIGQEVLTGLSELSLREGNLCNVRLRGNPRFLGSIVEGEVGRPNKVFALELNDLTQEPYAGNSIYKIVISNIFDAEEKSHNKISFYPGENVYATLCLENIQFFEFDLSQTETNRIEKTKNENYEKLKKEKIELEYKKKHFASIQSKTYNLEEQNQKEFEKAIDNQIISIYSFFNRSNKSTYPLYFPSFEDLTFSEEKFQTFSSVYKVTYLIPIYRNPNGDVASDFIKEFSCISGQDKNSELISRIASKFNNLKIENVNVETEIRFDSLDINFTRGVSNIKIRKGKIKFLDEIPNTKIQLILEEKINKLSNGMYLLKYENGIILGKEIFNVWTEEISKMRY